MKMENNDEVSDSTNESNAMLVFCFVLEVSPTALKTENFL